MQKIICQYFSFAKNKHSVLKVHIDKLLQNKNIKDYLDKILTETPQWQNYRYIIFGIIFKQDLKKCKKCGKYILYSKQRQQYCSKKCSTSATEVINKANQKRIQTYLQHYGTTNNMKSPQFIKKLKQHNMLHYGVQWLTQLQSTKQIYKKNMLQKYGVENIFQTAECKDKIRKAFQTKTIEQLTLIRQKTEQTCLQKYGVKNVFQNQNIINNIKTKRYNRQYKNFSRFKDKVIPLFTRQQYIGDGYYDRKYKWKCVICGNIFFATAFNCDIPRCLNCYPYVSGFSNMQKQLAQFCKQYFPNIQQNDRALIKPYQLDIVISQIKLAIEFNGLYWHSIEAGYQLGHHLKKTQMCQKLGYRLIHIWQDQWVNDKELIKQKLINIFTNSEMIDYSKPLDRCWYSVLQFQNYQIMKPQIIVRDGFSIENCGYISINQ